MIGAVADPDPFRASVPVQAPPAFKQTASPGWNVVAFTFVNVCQAVAGVAPSFVSRPADASMKYVPALAVAASQRDAVKPPVPPAPALPPVPMTPPEPPAPSRPAEPPPP